MKALVTGADGFVGRWLVEHLEAAGDDVWRATGSRDGDAEKTRAIDLRDPESVEALISWAEPEVIYHLAAVAFGPDAATDIGQALDVTVRGTAYLFDSAAGLPTPPCVVIPSSSEVYGAVDRKPVREQQPTEPMNLYGATKIAQEALAFAFHRSRDIPVVVARAFNHMGPGQRASFVVPAFATQLAKIAAEDSEPVIRTGNLSAERDFTDVRDVVRAYRLLVVGEHFGVPVNVASGHAVSVQWILDELIAASGLQVDVVVDPTRLRAADNPVVIGSAERLREFTGWEPEHDLASTIHEVWLDAVDRVSSDARN